MGFVTLIVLLYIVQIHGSENLALHQPTWEEYTWPDESRDFGSENAVDGMYTDRGAHGGQCTISDDSKYNATWRVDLGRVVSISHIDIYYRTDNIRMGPFLTRMAGFFVYVSNTTSKNDGYLCYHDESTERTILSEDQHINCSLQGRYVIYYNERRPGVVYPIFYSEYAYNGLCEVEVYVCNNNTYGPACALNCGNCSNGETCHHINGTCLHGCAEGTTGDTCQEGCQSGYYGRNCTHRCSESCIVTNQCDRVTGRCDGGCKQGWTGNTCDQIRATDTQPSSCTESYNIVIVVVSLLIVVTGSMINFVIWKRNAAKFSRMSLGNMPQPTSNREDKDHQYTELEEVVKSKTYEEIHRYSN